MALIKNVSDLQKYLPVNADLNIAGILPFINAIEASIIIKNISQTQYDDLNTAYNGAGCNSDQQKLLDKVQPAVAFFAFKEWIPVAQVILDNSGIRIANTNEMKTAFQWQIDKLEDSALRNAYIALEQLLAFMETNKSVYTLWAASTSYTIYKEGFINTANDFNTYYNINQSRLTFLALKASMRKTEDFDIKGSIDATLFALIKTQIKANSLDSDNTALMAFIQPAVAHLTIAKAIDSLAVTMDDRGIIVYKDTGRITTRAFDGAGDTMLDSLHRRALEDGQNYLKQLRDYLNTNASVSKYATYFASALYIDLTKNSEVVKNNPLWGMIGL